MTKPRPEVRVTNRHRLLDDFFVVEAANVRFVTGETETRATRILVFHRGDGAAAVLVDKAAEELVLVRQFRFPTYENGPGWVDEVVAGTVSKNERANDTMKREITEETGYSVAHIEHVMTFYVSPGGSSERIFLYYAEIDPTEPRKPFSGDRYEGLTMEEVRIPFAEVWSRLDRGDFLDAKTIIGLQWLRRRVEQGVA